MNVSYLGSEVKALSLFSLMRELLSLPRGWDFKLGPEELTVPGRYCGRLVTRGRTIRAQCKQVPASDRK